MIDRNAGITLYTVALRKTKEHVRGIGSEWSVTAPFSGRIRKVFLEESFENTAVRRIAADNTSLIEGQLPREFLSLDRLLEYPPLFVAEGEQLCLFTMGPCEGVTVF